MDEKLFRADAVAFAAEKLGFHPDKQQEELLRGPERRVLLNCTRQWGKSTVTAVKAVHRAWSRAGSLTVVVGACERQAAEFLRKAGDFVRKLGIRPRGDGDNDISLLLPNGSRVVGLPGVSATIRGFSAVSMLIVDEAAQVRDDVFTAVLPFVAVSGGDVWALSTPNGKRGFFWEAWSKGGELWRRVSVPATECPRIAAEFLEEQRRTLAEWKFRQEYMCEFMEQEGAVFSEESITGALSSKVEAWDFEF